MSDRPIIFSGPMVRALLDGRKTQTRRVLKHQSGWRTNLVRVDSSGAWFCDGHHPKHHACEEHAICVRIPYAPGDRLYVREAHALVPSTAYRFSPGVPYAVNDEDGSQACVYREGWERSRPGTGWRPSIHMPRWASRLTLTVTEVRVQRLQEISEADAAAEGIERHIFADWPSPCFPIPGVPVWGAGDCMPTARDAYACLWMNLHGPDAWDANPWVVAVTFTVERRNIDAQEPTP